jgi:hypothetical protein
VLARMNCFGDLEGAHQHGFKPKHSTATAILDLQRIISEERDSGNDCAIYSIDLSVAFDMLRKNTLIRDLHPLLVEAGLDRVIYDFLSGRKCKVEVNGEVSREFNVELGCVQGSVLGPKLFNLYTRMIPCKLPLNASITTYADDSYVVISAKKGDKHELIDRTNVCLETHVNYLRELGMVVNKDKTEIIIVPCNSSIKGNVYEEVKFGDVKPLKLMKVLGITMDDTLSWSPHIAITTNKMARLTGALKFLRRRLTKEQFMPVLTSQYYGMTYYASQVWLGPHTKRIDIKKLNSLHYKLLRIAINDWRNKTSKKELDLLGRAKPMLWARYATANIVIKILRDRAPMLLLDHLELTKYSERRTPEVIKFYDKSNTKIGFQAIGNLIGKIFNEINAPITLSESNAAIRTLLKKSLNFIQ